MNAHLGRCVITSQNPDFDQENNDALYEEFKERQQEEKQDDGVEDAEEWLNDAIEQLFHEWDGILTEQQRQWVEFTRQLLGGADPREVDP